jgi:hypothetical protein
MPEVIAADVASLWVVLGGSEVVIMAFPFVFALAVWGVMMESDTTSVAPVLPLDAFGTGVGIVGVGIVGSASSSASAPASAPGRGRGRLCLQCCCYGISDVLLELLSSEARWFLVGSHAGAWVGGDNRRDVRRRRLEDRVVGLS